MNSMKPLEDEMLGAPSKEINFKKYLLKLLERWHIILIFFIVCVAIGYSINRYATPVFSVKARITTRKFSNKPSTPIPGLVDANFFLNGLSEVYEEIPLLKSPRKIEAALEKMDYRVSYFAKSLIKKDPESIRGYGFDVEIDTINGADYPFGVPIYVNHTSERTFQLTIEGTPWNKVVARKTFEFDKQFQLGDATIHIINTNGKTIEPDKYYFVLNRKSDLVAEFTHKLNINWAMRGSTMLDLRIDTESPDKDLQFMKAYYQVVERTGLEEKNETLENTIEFIDAQMAIVSDSLTYYQEIIDRMKLQNRSLAENSEDIYTNLNELDKQRAEVELNERYFNYLTDYFKTNSKAEIFAPSLVGLDIPPLESWVNTYIDQKLQEKYQRNEENSQNPLVNREDSLKGRLEKGIFEAIRSARVIDSQKLAEINAKTAAIYGNVGNIQSDFRELSKFQRMYQLNQTLFDLFLRRRTEAAISKASATSDYKIIDAPAYSKAPISPDETTNLIIAAALGLCLPIGFFLISDITNRRIMDKDDLEMITSIPMLGNIAHSKYNTHLVISEHPKSVVSESFRAVRANLRYMPSVHNTNAKTFILTSSVGGEGKTFCSLNLACTMAITNRKTILIAADLRKPQLSAYMGTQQTTRGLAEYLAGFCTIEEVIVKGDSLLPDYIDSGNIPPNPSELLSSERMKELMARIKSEYEYIIIDTPPIGLVSDAFELFKYADHNILIVRQGVTQKDALRMINELYVVGRLENFSLLFNDIEINKRGNQYYGGYLYGMGYSGYGYGYYQEDNKKLKKKKTI